MRAKEERKWNGWKKKWDKTDGAADKTNEKKRRKNKKKSFSLSLETWLVHQTITEIGVLMLHILSNEPKNLSGEP